MEQELKWYLRKSFEQDKQRWDQEDVHLVKKKKKIPVREIVFDNLKISSKKNLHIP